MMKRSLERRPALDVLGWKGLRAMVFMLALPLFAAPGLAATYPERSVDIILPYGPGGTGDVIARLVSEKLALDLGKPVVVLNKPGAAGVIGATAAARAKPDGHTLLLGYTSEIVISPYLVKDAAYEVGRDFVPIAMAGSTPLLLVANPKLNLASIDQVVERAKAKPGVLSYATAGVGSPADIAGRLLEKSAGINLINVPYKGGSQATTDVVAGVASMYFAGMPPAVPFIKSGQLVPLGVTSKTRSPTLPDVPALASEGFPSLDLSGWFGFFAPAGLDPEIMDMLSRKINHIMDDAEVKEKLQSLGVVTEPMAQADFARFVAAEQKKYAALIKDLNISY